MRLSMNNLPGVSNQAFRSKYSKNINFQGLHWNSKGMNKKAINDYFLDSHKQLERNQVKNPSINEKLRSNLQPKYNQSPPLFRF
mmetsp:Transcript_17414/g.16611  ORF Transcript_17414/g.16611 Transcript_17414/m.16611 type:complete len:84 (-) Transcript_17414:326-577(-)